MEDGHATKIQGDRAHPVTRGFLCAKVAKYLDRVYSPDRVLYPMRRVKPKGLLAGEGARATQAGQAFERIAWDEALEEITSQFRKIISEFGRKAILPYSYGGTLATLNGGSMDRRFFHRLGASQLARNICSAARDLSLSSAVSWARNRSSSRAPATSSRGPRTSTATMFTCTSLRKLVERAQSW